MSIHGIEFFHRKNLWHNNYANRIAGKNEATNLITGEVTKIVYGNGGNERAEYAAIESALRSVPGIDPQIPQLLERKHAAMTELLHSFDTPQWEPNKLRLAEIEKSLDKAVGAWRPQPMHV